MSKSKTTGLRQWVWRLVIYLLGLLTLGAGISMNTMTGLGVSPIMAIPYAVSQIWNVSFADMTMILYLIFVAIQFVLKGREATVFDVLQIVLSIVFSRYLDLYQRYLWIECRSFPQQLLLLAAAIAATGIGVAMSTSMRLIPNPGDGAVQALSDRFGKSMGFAKNLFDGICIVIAVVIGLVFGHTVIGIGIGTVGAMAGIGRVIAVFQHFFNRRMLAAAGLDQNFKNRRKDL